MPYTHYIDLFFSLVIALSPAINEIVKTYCLAKGFNF